MAMLTDAKYFFFFHNESYTEFIYCEIKKSKHNKIKILQILYDKFDTTFQIYFLEMTIFINTLILEKLKTKITFLNNL